MTTARNVRARRSRRASRRSSATGRRRTIPPRWSSWSGTTPGRRGRPPPRRGLAGVRAGELLAAVLIAEDGPAAEDEEHLLCAEVHVEPRLRRAGVELVQRCSHPGVVRSPEDSLLRPGFGVLSVPCVGEEVLTIHSWYLRVVAVGAQHPSRLWRPGNTAPKTATGEKVSKIVAFPTRREMQRCFFRHADGTPNHDPSLRRPVAA